MNTPNSQIIFGLPTHRIFQCVLNYRRAEALYDAGDRLPPGSRERADYYRLAAEAQQIGERMDTPRQEIRANLGNFKIGL